MAGGCANVQVEPTEARGGARSSRRWTAGALREDELTEEGKQAVDLEEKQVNRRAQEETPSALGQLNQRLERIEEQPKAPSTADGSLRPAGPNQNGLDGA
eukprot:664668-Pyramimonas_sp.AAC.1